MSTPVRFSILPIITIGTTTIGTPPPSTLTTTTNTTLLSCSSSFLTPSLSRASTNNRCIVNSKFTITYTIVTIENQKVLIPCPLVKYLSEIKVLMKTQSLKNALIEVANKYNIPIEQPQNIKRYTYPTVNGRISIPPIQYNATFKLVGYPQESFSNYSPSSNYTIINNIFYQLGVCNDDTKTFSYTYPDMKLNAGYLLSTLNIVPINGTMLYCITCRTNDRNLTKTITGVMYYLNLGDGPEDARIFFNPVISRVLLARYIPYEYNTDITILYTSTDLKKTLAYNIDTFHKGTL